MCKKNFGEETCWKTKTQVKFNIQIDLEEGDSVYVKWSELPEDQMQW